jgi:hypothetical protein
MHNSQSVFWSMLTYRDKVAESLEEAGMHMKEEGLVKSPAIEEREHASEKI